MNKNTLSFEKTIHNMTLRLRVIDLETTGAHPLSSEVIEFGAVDVFCDNDTWQIGDVRTRLFRPSGPLTPETQAVHHLMDEDFTPDMPHATPEALSSLILGDPAPDMLVAHHIAFERHFLTDAMTGGLPWLCTLRASQKLWPEAPRHTNQILRYWLGLDLDRHLASPAHRAGPDAYVTAHILMRQLALASPEELFRLTQSRHVRRGAALRAGRDPYRQEQLFG
ncbi:DNA polymerase III subunit epsilon [Asaia krungthepensis NRIC 0535]|uniref:DNA polymerase III subunit epsilon n=2 Tax=Asaia krungthepensis TaxID=220990 RepID=A0ABQ0Q121_9PROT|nr:DNA polymerase III subunit epsilon [Asaia krungthepensis NRIC 0535]